MDFDSAIPRFESWRPSHSEIQENKGFSPSRTKAISRLRGSRHASNPSLGSPHDMATHPYRPVRGRNIIAGLIVLVPIPTLGKGPAAKAFLDEICRHYLGSSTSDAKGIELTNAKAARAYFTVGLASLIIEAAP